MGDESTPLSRAEARHLLRRSGFGALPKEVDAITGMPRGTVVDDLLDFIPSNYKLRGDDNPSLHRNWLRYIIRPRNLQRTNGLTNYLRFSRHALQEKLAMFWHDHFACNATVVGYAPIIIKQNNLFRRSCKGNFKTFVKVMNTDPMLMAFLDTPMNRKAQPNENYARELMELFTLGVTDFAGQKNYEQADIVQIARAFSGWTIDVPNVQPIFLGDPACDGGQHDYSTCFPERGPKVIFRNTGGFGPAGRSIAANGEGAMEIDTVIDILFDHRDTEGHNTVARHIARKLFTFFAHAAPEPAVIDQLIAESSFATAFELQPLLRRLFVDDAFYATAGSSADGAPKSVKWPVDFAVSTLRLLRMQLKGKYQYLPGGNFDMRYYLTDMGQRLLHPPTVFGWDWEQAWLSSGRLLARFRFATGVISSRVGGRSGFRPSRLVDLRLTDPGDIVDAVTDLLGVADQITPAERQVFIDYLGGPLDLHDAAARNTKLNGLFGLVLVSPAYQLH